MDFIRSYIVSSRKCIEYNNLRITYKIKVFRKKNNNRRFNYDVQKSKIKKREKLVCLRAENCN